ncbi:DNA polymerase III subunit gamma/tau [Oscillibacter hominis]|uniref:DNA-directed DNA polymerase n=1 Tax=Oscillibacter hominis TaxID=2763056 RepID=A0A7G9B4H3_9FIRM|nr:DNA polymerase III subunit gamma/tau [Oscillibacter hominis]QNL44454.1 DNA polymerase III subunit gamma/tau [Oscillibacter hominis]
MYQALYRKWRPKTFSDVVGQSHITQTLQKQVCEGRTSHAYLFTGTRGTGKTTCAKILAKAVNCEHPVNGDPCNECASCKGIENGSFLDVLELDAASNNGVDQVRALRDEAIYTPAQVKKRVYIVDEVHMLSTPAFNALLKILEEPPEHLMFILATTELHKVPATILSRCQRFSFKRITPKDIEQRLLYVAGQEQIDLTGDGAELLSRLSDGALRDALSLLDQCAASGGTVDSDAVLEVLGLAGNLQTARMMDCILRKDAKSALLLLNQLYGSGKDVGAVLGELSTLTRDLLLRKTAPEGGAALLSGGYDSRTLDALDKTASARQLIYLATTLQETTANLLRSANRRTDAELCLLRLCDESLTGDLTALCARMDRLEERVRQMPAVLQTSLSRAAPSAPPNPGTAPETNIAPPVPEAPDGVPPAYDPPPWEEPSAQTVVEERPPLPEEPPIVPQEPDAPQTKAAPPSGANVWWQRLAEECKGQLPAMNRVYLDKVTGTLDGGLLTVTCPDELTKGRLDTDRVRGVLIAQAAELAGKPVRLTFVLGQTAEPSPEERMKNLIDFGSKFDSFQIK